MAWCPMCKSEYVEGVTTCVDCGCELVTELADENEEQLDEELLVAMMAKAQEIRESGEKLPEELEDFSFDEESTPPKYKAVYINNEEKAQENKSSAYTLLLVGGLGLIAVLLFFFDVIRLNVTIASKYMITGVMGVLFILFIIMGIVSLRNSKILRIKACKENNLTLEIKKWCQENLHKEEIEQKLSNSEQPVEIQYFQNIEYMKKMIKNQFVNLDESYLDRLIDEVYTDIFEVTA